MHPDHVNETIAIGRSGPSWKNQKTKLIPNGPGVPWEPRMQQVTIDYVYPQWAAVIPMYPEMQREGINTMGDIANAAFDEDSTLIWRTNYLKYIVLDKIN